MSPKVPMMLWKLKQFLTCFLKVILHNIWIHRISLLCYYASALCYTNRNKLLICFLKWINNNVAVRITYILVSGIICVSCYLLSLSLWTDRSDVKEDMHSNFIIPVPVQGIILKENKNIGDAERMFIQVSIWIFPCLSV